MNKELKESVINIAYMFSIVFALMSFVSFFMTLFYLQQPVTRMQIIMPLVLTTTWLIIAKNKDKWLSNSITTTKTDGTRCQK